MYKSSLLLLAILLRILLHPSVGPTIAIVIPDRIQRTVMASSSHRQACDISFIFLICLLLVLPDVHALRDYRGYAVLKAIPKTEQQLYYLQSLEELVQSPPFDVDIWKASAQLNDPTHIMINLKASRSILQEFDELDLDYSYTIPDVAQ